LRKLHSGQVLELCHKEGLSLEQAVERVQPPTPPPAVPNNNIPLYQFLQLAGVIGAKDIEDALKVASRDSHLMGQMLLLTGVITPDLLSVALKCSDLLRGGVLKTEQAVIALGICSKTQVPLEEAFRQLGWSPTLLTSPYVSPERTLTLPAQNAPQNQAQTGSHQLPTASGDHPPQTSQQIKPVDMEQTMPPGTSHLKAGDKKPTDTGEMSPIKEGESKPSSPKKRLADLIP